MEVREMRRPVDVIFFACLITVALTAAPRAIAQDEQGRDEWTGSIEQKVSGLMTVWAEVKYNYPFFDKQPDLDWDRTAQAYIPGVIAAQTREDYYKLLMELVANLNDGHTMVMHPGAWPVGPEEDWPPIELRVIDGEYIVSRVEETSEIKEQDIYPGLRVLEIDGKPVADHFEEEVLRYENFGTRHASEALLLYKVLRGPAGTGLQLRVEDITGELRAVELTRNSRGESQTPFFYRVYENYFTPDVLSAELREDGIMYIRIASFGREELVDEFRNLMNEVNLDDVRGVIIDLRFNPGGNSLFGDAIVSCLIDEPIQPSIYRTRQYVPAYRSWGKEEEVLQESFSGGEIKPSEDVSYTGPMVVLTNNSTVSAAEDFTVLLDSSGRAILVGEKTAGTTGNPVHIPLPGGGVLMVVSLIALYPDGTEFVGVGIEPDVVVHPTRDDIHSGYDRILAKGIEVLNNRDRYRKN
jgi:C-terminal processing protease CtpA/Prc